eukprot:scaffold341950_cov28-Prasinocladus_malaysianus.AAC.1
MEPADGNRALELFRRGVDLHARSVGYKAAIEANRDISRQARLAELPEPPSEAIHIIEQRAAPSAPTSSARAASSRSRANPTLTKAKAKAAPAPTFAR